MPAERIAMRQVRDVLRLNAAGVPRQRDRAPGRRGAVDGSVDVEAARCRWARLAVADRDDRRGAGGAALYRGWQEAGSPPPRRTRLGRGSPRAEAQARHAADPVGRVYRAAPRRVSLLAVLRTVPGLGLPDLGHDAADPRRRR